MGLLHHRRDEGDPNRFIMKERLIAVGQDYYIENTQGMRCYWVDGKALRVRETIIFKELDGREIYKIQQRKVRLRDTMKTLDPGDGTVATIHKHLISPIHQRFDIDVAGEQEMHAKGNILAHEYKVTCEGKLMAQVSKKWVRIRDTYAVEVTDGVDVPFMLAITAAIDTMSDPG